MTYDPSATPGVVTRQVRGGFRDGTPTRIVIARRLYPASQAELWNTLTSAERIPRWFLPVSGELRVGGRYQLEGNAGGVVERCKEPESFAVTWEFGGAVSWVEVTLIPVGGHTALELAHEAPLDADMWGTSGPGAVGVGWDLALHSGLGSYVDTGDSVDLKRAAAFTASPGGAAFIRASAQGWAAAAIEDGDDPEAARQAAERTVAFYTPAPGSTGQLRARGLRGSR
jgi:uncharacterized protein YndB with AHSA1/START domain